MYLQPELILSVVDAEHRRRHSRQMYSTPAESIGRLRTADTDWAMFGYYIRNNVGIAFQCFAGGLFAGLGSLFFLAFNGALIGGGRRATSPSAGSTSTFFPFVATHSRIRVDGDRAVGAAGLRDRPRADRARAAHARTGARESRKGSRRDRLWRDGDAADRRRDRGLLVVGAAGCPSVAKYQRRGRVLDRRAQLPDVCRVAVQIDALAIRLRPRSPLEAADLGVRLCQSTARPVYRCYAMVAIPVSGVCRWRHSRSRPGCRRC